MKQYLTKTEAAEELQASPREVEKVVAGIREQMGPGKRYGQYSLRGSRKLLQIRYAVFTDYLRYKDYFGDETLEKHIPPFNVRDAERDLGVVQGDFQQIQIDTDAIADAVLQRFLRQLAQQGD